MTSEATPTPRPPLSKLLHDPDVRDDNSCDGCGRRTTTVTVAMLGYGIDVLGNDDESGGLDVQICAPCLRALADKADQYTLRVAGSSGSEQ